MAGNLIVGSLSFAGTRLSNNPNSLLTSQIENWGCCFSKEKALELFEPERLVRIEMFSSANNSRPLTAISRKERDSAPLRLSSARDQSKFVETENGIFEQNTFYRVANSKRAITHQANALSALCTVFDFPSRRRGLIVGLFALSNGSTDWFDSPHLALGKKLFQIDTALTGEKLEKREESVRRQTRGEIQKLMKWQTETGITLVEYAEGGRINTYDVSSKFRLPILEMVAETLKEFPLCSKSKNRMAEAARVVAERHVEDLRSRKPKTRQVMQQPSPNRWRKTATTAAEKYAKETGRGADAILEIITELNELRVRLKGENAQNENGKSLVIKDFSDYSRTHESSPSVHSESISDTQTVPLTIESQGGQNCSDEVLPPACDSISPTVAVAEPSKSLPLSDQSNAAWRTLSVLQGVGAEPDQVLLLDDTKPKKEKLQQSVECDLRTFAKCMESLTNQAEQNHWSTVVRFRGPVLQCDDCDRETMELLKPFALVGWQTSPNNYQVWLAFNDDQDKEAVAQRLFAGVRGILPQSQINSGSGGATRWIGTRNFKPSRRQQDGTFPLVELVFLQPGRIVTPNELESIGLLAEPVALVASNESSHRASATSGWPSYEIALAGAPPRADGEGADLSRADARYATYAFTRYGKTRQQIAEKLAEVSQHNHPNSLEYGWLTANEVGNWLEIQHNRQYL